MIEATAVFVDVPNTGWKPGILVAGELVWTGQEFFPYEHGDYDSTVENRAKMTATALLGSAIGNLMYDIELQKRQDAEHQKRYQMRYQQPGNGLDF